MSEGYKIRNQCEKHFVTFTTVAWVDVFTRKECKEIFMDSLKHCVMHKGPYVHAYVIMSNHIHLILSADRTSQGLSAIIRDLKSITSKAMTKWISTSKRESRSRWLLWIFRYHSNFNNRNVNYQFWQQNNKPKELIHPRFTRRVINYIHQNPVKAGIVDEASDYRYSSARNYAGRMDGLICVDCVD